MTLGDISPGQRALFLDCRDLLVNDVHEFFWRYPPILECIQALNCDTRTAFQSRKTSFWVYYFDFGKFSFVGLVSRRRGGLIVYRAEKSRTACSLAVSTGTGSCLSLLLTVYNFRRRLTRQH